MDTVITSAGNLAAPLHPFAVDWLRTELGQIINAAVEHADSFMPDEDLTERTGFIKVAALLSRVLDTVR
jgi:hypothetical protein